MDRMAKAREIHANRNGSRVTLLRLKAPRAIAIMLAKEIPMGQILVRKIDDALKSKLQQLAKKHGHSMEQEVRNILRNAVKDEGRAEKGLGTAIAERFKDLGITEDIQELRGYTLNPPKFD